LKQGTAQNGKKEALIGWKRRGERMRFLFCVKEECGMCACAAHNMLLDSEECEQKIKMWHVKTLWRGKGGS